ncbi:VWA domain-containing protein [Corynebacterium mendelii]|uniref:VWA domain-containing protein n=1 Tax=Corynebacterium mendelii TaxID=2765362 RepID=A0A939E108_9CORY|nr:VWA domain-containing protein [Corynebacterium mendelii]MBN9644979.1 VWA domain-containing protein [Corynebacterium mendelii]
MSNDPKLLCMLVLDVSESMGWGEKGKQPIDLLNNGFAKFCGNMSGDPNLTDLVEVGVVTFSTRATLVHKLQPVAGIQHKPLQAKGITNFSAGIRAALEEVARRKKELNDHGRAVRGQWIVIVSDGGPTDGEGNIDALCPLANEAVELAVGNEKKSGGRIYPVAVGKKADREYLARLSVRNKVTDITQFDFGALFDQLLYTITQTTVYNHNAPEMLQPETRIIGQRGGYVPLAGFTQVSRGAR